MSKALALAAAALGLALLSAAPALAQADAPVSDEIVISAAADQEAALEELAAGRSELFDHPINGLTLASLSPAEKAAIEAFEVHGASYVDLEINPYPDQAPYTAKAGDGTVIFNPFAIRAVRYAMNFLIDRNNVVADIMHGSGSPIYSPLDAVRRDGARFAALTARLGLTAEGDEAAALADIEAAMRQAAASDRRLVKAGPWWTYDGKPVTVKFLIRRDDPQLRLPLGLYVADRIEKAGIKVERLELDRNSCSAIVNRTDPADCEWNLYTEAWGGFQPYEFWDGVVAQMYAPWASYMPGGGRADQWNYQNGNIDRLTRDLVDYRVSTGGEYYDKLTAATELGLRDAVRIFIASPTTYICASKSAFRAPIPAGDGIDRASLYAAKVARGPEGLRILRMALYAKGPLFPSAWDPVGPFGFADYNSSLVAGLLARPEYGFDPADGAPVPEGAAWSDVRTGAIDFDATPPDGSIHVPADAVLWNARDRRWERGINYADLSGNGTLYDYVKTSPAKDLAWSEATFRLRFGRWQDGRRMDMNDYRYALARPYELCLQRSESDKVYDDSYAASMSAELAKIKGLVFKGDTITVYGDYNNPMDRNALAAALCPTLAIGGENSGAVVSWPIHEALKVMVAEGSASKTTWVFNDEGSGKEVDLLDPTCVSDIEAELGELAARKTVPACLAGYLKPAEAVAAYEKARAFVAAHGNALISNGGFMIDNYDAGSGIMVLKAFRRP